MQILNTTKSNIGIETTSFKGFEYKKPKPKTHCDECKEVCKTPRGCFINQLHTGVNKAQREGDSYISKALISIKMNKHPSYIPFKEKEQLWVELLGLCKQDGFSWWWNKTEIK